MPRARTTRTFRQTAASPQDSGSGCLSGFAFIPLSVILVSYLLASLAAKVNINEISSVSSSAWISAVFTPEVQYWARDISRWAASADLDPNLVATVMQIESCGNPRARSSAGAMGLFQVMPYHFQISDNPYNPDTNALRGLAYLKRSLDSAGGDPRLALAGYNGGVGVISRPEWAWPEETKRYVRYGWPIYNAAHIAAPSPETVQEWHQKYNGGLCRQARQSLGIAQ